MAALASLPVYHPAMAESAPKRARLRLKTKRNISPPVTSTDHTDKAPVVEFTSAVKGTDVITNLAQPPRIDLGVSGNSRTEPEIEENPLTQLRHKITSLLPGYLNFESSPGKRIAEILVTENPIPKTSVNDTKTPMVEVENQKITWTPLPKTCRRCAIRKPPRIQPEIVPHGQIDISPQKTALASNMKPDTDISMVDKTRGILDMKIEDTMIDEEIDDEELLNMATPFSPVHVYSDEITNKQQPLPGPSRVSDQQNISHCPLCNLNFSQELSQIDIDGHIAVCYSKADDDVNW